MGLEPAALWLGSIQVLALNWLGPRSGGRHFDQLSGETSYELTMPPEATLSDALHRAVTRDINNWPTLLTQSFSSARAAATCLRRD